MLPRPPSRRAPANRAKTRAPEATRTGRVETRLPHWGTRAPPGVGLGDPKAGPPGVAARQEDRLALGHGLRQGVPRPPGPPAVPLVALPAETLEK